MPDWIALLLAILLFYSLSIYPFQGHKHERFMQIVLGLVYLFLYFYLLPVA